MATILRRYRWPLMALGVVLAASALAASWMLLPDSSGRFTREQYGRIQLGMTSEEVKSVMACPPTGGLSELFKMDDLGPMDLVLQEGGHDFDRIGTWPVEHDHWIDEPVFIGVNYLDGKVVEKQWIVHAPRWKTEAWLWLRRVGEFVGL